MFKTTLQVPQIYVSEQREQATYLENVIHVFTKPGASFDST
jgi:hypothetical protein